jgi:hypothetical protein
LRNIRDIADRIILILRGERFRTNAVAMLAWVKDTYKTDTSQINMGFYIPASIYYEPDMETQSMSMRKKATYFYSAICKLREIRYGAELELLHRTQRFPGDDPIREMLKKEASARFDSIWRMKGKMLTDEQQIRKGDSPINRLIRECESIRDRADDFLTRGELVCHLETYAGHQKLCAAPKDLDKQLHNDLWGKGFPIILIAGG